VSSAAEPRSVEAPSTTATWRLEHGWSRSPGWEMPVQYEGIRAEHLAVRRDAGVFDVSHMGEVETRGPQALEFLSGRSRTTFARFPRVAPSTA